jgi:hypothetical protein
VWRFSRNQNKRGNMKLNRNALAMTAGILWALVVLFVGVANLIWTDYGAAFLGIVASIYPGYDGAPTVSDVVVGTLYALVDGAVCGWVFAWLYNLFAGKRSTA